jgi:hypothetical protein
VNVTRIANNELEIRLSQREQDLFLAVLKLYPRMPAPLSPDKTGRSSGALMASHRLLQESLAEHRAQTQNELRRWLSDASRWRQKGSLSAFRLKEAEAEMLLQVFNDIRVGSWVALGSPEERRPLLNQQSAPDIWAMDLAGHFQMAVLLGLRGGESCSTDASDV